MDDITEIIAKTDKEIGFIDFVIKCTKNSNFIKSFYEIDEYLTKLETTIGSLDKFE